MIASSGVSAPPSSASSAAGAPAVSASAAPAAPAAAPVPTASSQARDIVERLNAPPFDRNLTLVTFDQLSPAALLVLLNDVLRAIDSTVHPADMRDESPEFTAFRIADFLRVMQYRHLMDSVQFQQSLLSGEKSVIHGVLHWLLPRMQELQMRAYLARFLVNVEVPPEYMTDAAMSDAYATYRDMQEQFKAVHRQYMAARAAATDPAAVRKEINALDSERDQLTSKIEELRLRVKDTPQLDTVLAASQRLRMAREGVRDLKKQLAELEVLRERATEEHRAAARRLDEMRSNAMHGNPQQVVQQLRIDAAEARRLVQQALPNEIDFKRRRADELRRVIGEMAYPDQEAARLQSEIGELTRALNALEQARDQQLRAALGNAGAAAGAGASASAAAGGAGEDKLPLYRQQAAVVAKKRAESERRLAQLRTEYEAVVRDLQERQKHMSSFRGSKDLLTGNFKEFAVKLREKGAQARKLKADLDAVSAEVAVLQRTEQILRTRNDRLQDFVEEVERKRGVAGYQQTQAELETISAQKSSVDENKEKTLQEISGIVMQINARIAERKQLLAPQIKELKALRAEYTELKREYDAQKSAYENTSAGLEAERAKLTREVTTYTEECARDESRYHYTNQMLLQANARIAQTVAEGKSRASGDKVHSLRAQLQKRIAELEAQTKELRTTQKKVKDQLGPAMRQMAMFGQLQQLLQAKLQSLKVTRDAADDDGGALDMHDAAATYGVDRLVL